MGGSVAGTVPYLRKPAEAGRDGNPGRRVNGRGRGMTTQEQRRRNLRLGLVLAAVVVALYAGFVVFRYSLLGG
ncbi:hypothetical protein ALISP_4649 [Alicycliphilus sp. B1]|nr:hypothetical protein ALISP_4649 [Alicycliphilus sp. B1]